MIYDYLLFYEKLLNKYSLVVTLLHKFCMNLESFKMVFRSNRANRFPGFSATTICFHPGSMDPDGGMTRKKRSQQDFANPGPPVSTIKNGMVVSYF